MESFTEEVKRSLVELQVTGYVDLTHGKYSMKHTYTTNRKYIIIDLGNIHDLLPRIDDEIYSEFSIICFADRVFNGYGIKPPPKNKDIMIYQSPDEFKNSADIHLVWTVCSICEVSENNTFYVVTKDKGFNSLELLVRKKNSMLKFFKTTPEFMDYFMKYFYEFSTSC